MNKCKLGDVASVIISNVDKKSYENEIKVKLCNFTDVYYNWAITLRDEPKLMVATATNNEICKYKLHKGDVAITKDSETKEDIGQSTLIADEIPDMLLGYHCALIRPNSNKLLGAYLNAVLHTKLATRYFELNASGSGQRYTLSVDAINDFQLYLPSINEQERISKILTDIDRKIENNTCINDNLAQILRLLYEQWFYRFEFPNEQNLPYNRANGELEWNDKLKRRIPKGWKVQTMLSNELFSVISSGIDRFSTKKYYATADIIGSSIGEGSDIEYETRESRANMQPVINSVWFAKMKNSIKHLFLNKEMSSFVDNSILSTGFYGLKCNEISFEYIASVVSAPIFEITKDRLSHGATQQGIGDDDMANITLLIPDDTTLRKYHEATKGFFAKISNNILENKRLIAIRNFLLPLLMNGQATIAE